MVAISSLKLQKTTFQPISKIDYLSLSLNSGNSKLPNFFVASIARLIPIKTPLKTPSDSSKTTFDSSSLSERSSVTFRILGGMARTKMPNKNGDSNEKFHGPSGKTPPGKRYRSKVRTDVGSKAPGSAKKKQAEKKKPSAAEKGKGKADPSPMDKRPHTPNASDTESDSFEAETRAAIAASKLAHIRKKPRSGNTSSAPSTGAPPIHIPECDLPFLDGNLDEGVNKVNYNKYYREKIFCPVVSVNLQNLKNDPKYNLDLTHILGRYECWLSINDEFCPEVVRRFYCNMKSRTGYQDVEQLVQA